MTAIRRAGVLLRGILAAVILVSLVAGVPVLLLLTVGNPIPETWTWSAPLTNAALLSILACTAWVFWAQLVLCVIVEAIAEIRCATGRSGDWLSRVPGTFGGQQALARTLIQAVVAIGATTTAAATMTPWIPHADAADVSTPVAAPSAAAALVAAVADEPAYKRNHHATIEVIVVRGDTLWSIAEQHLGAGERWREIAELNRGSQMVDGSIFDDARTILPGWKLLVPAIASRHGDHHVVTVERGDTLWEIAEGEYGDGTKWPRIYRANGDRIDDPHLIYPGQEILVPRPRVVAPQVPTEHLPADPPVTPLNPPVVTPQAAEEPTPSAAPSSESPTEPTAVAPDEGADPRAESDDSGFHIDGATVTRGLLGGGGFLAAGMFAVYVARRRTQSRNRRSGKASPPVAAHLRADEKALRAIGSSASTRAAFFDATLQELAALAESESLDLPDVAAARIDSTRLDLRLRTPSRTAPPPWTVSSDGLVWSVSMEHRPGRTERMSPYPAMVTVGVDEGGGTWFVDLEAAGVVQIVGDGPSGEDLARFIAAELALNPWSDFESVDVVGVAHDVEPLNYGRLYAASKLDVEQLTKSARQMAEHLESTGRSVLASRVTGWEDAWVPTLCLASVAERELDTVRTQTAGLLDELERTPGRTSYALVVVSSAPLDPRAITLAFTSTGDLETPWSVVRPNRLTADEAAVLGQLFDDAETEGDVDIPAAVDLDGEPTNTDQAGALAEDLIEPRCGTGDPDSILPRPDRAYVESAATTVEDLDVLAPPVPRSEEATALASDPTLDQDLADWADPQSMRPKLRVLGPVELRAVGEKTKEVEGRPAYYAELAAYLACHPEGLTPNQVAAVFGIQNNTLHTRLTGLRKWLGKKPSTDEWYLPAAQWLRGQQVYQLSDVLVDADLFRRLRARGEALGPRGIDDFRRALELVSGQPYDQQRSKGYGWLSDTPVDHYATAAIVDVAHVYATHSLAEGRPRDALWAAEKAIAAAPSEDKPRLDLARAKQAMGDDEEAERYLRHEVFNRSDDDRAPLEPSARTVEVVDRMDRGSGA
jgi:hypothetical protein